VILRIERGALIDVIEHPNQQVLIVKIKNYAYLVPFVEDEDSRPQRCIKIRENSAKRGILKHNSVQHQGGF